MADTNQASGVESISGGARDERGKQKGPDGTAGDGAGNRAAEEGQGDDLSDRLGGGDGIGIRAGRARDRDEEVQDGR